MRYEKPDAKAILINPNQSKESKAKLGSLKAEARRVKVGAKTAIINPRIKSPLFNFKKSENIYLFVNS